MKIKTIKILITCCFLWACGLLVWHYQTSLLLAVSKVFPSFGYVYLTQDDELLNVYEQGGAEQVDWQFLIPEEQRAIIEKYQVPTAMNLAENILLSMNASTDQAYRDAMFSTDIVERWLGKTGSISGFIVPLEVGDNQSLQSFFLVPYFGACTHYPPPPPNQMIYIRLTGEFKMPDLNQAYTLTGAFKSGLYEDVLGTSAYQMDLMSMRRFSGQPDDFRSHQ
jgi:hypothetical protein